MEGFASLPNLMTLEGIKQIPSSDVYLINVAKTTMHDPVGNGLY